MFDLINIDNLTAFARGATGECFRLPQKRMLKLYFEGFDEEKIIREYTCSKLAFDAGISTPRPHGLFQVQREDASKVRKGIIYDMLEAKNLSELIVADPENIPDFGRTYASLALSIHNAAGDKSLLPGTTHPIRLALSKASYLDEKAMKRVEDYLDYLDTFSDFVHGDFHTNNILYADGKYYLVDMSSFSIGCGLFDIALPYFTMFLSPEAVSSEISSFTGLSRTMSRQLWEAFADTYFGQSNRYDQMRDKQLFDDIILLKEMRFEALYGGRYSEEYCQNIRKAVLDRFA